MLMRRGCAAILCLLACARASDDTLPKKACSSSLRGDYQFNSVACATFCKEAKQGNHCKFCKCKACTFCPADSSALASSALSPSAHALLSPRWPKKNVRSGVSNQSKCESGLKGDLPFVACGSFCKAAQASAHYKFCKCRSCLYCTAEGMLTAEAALVHAAARVTPRLRRGAGAGGRHAGRGHGRGGAKGAHAAGIRAGAARHTSDGAPRLGRRLEAAQRRHLNAKQGETKAQVEVPSKAARVRDKRMAKPRMAKPSQATGGQAAHGQATGRRAKRMAKRRARRNAARRAGRRDARRDARARDTTPTA